MLPFFSIGGVKLSETANLGLYVTDDSSERFSDWRAKINGTNDSNMTKIDEAFGTKADISVAINTTLLASAWEGDAAPYTQTLAVGGLEFDQNGIISLSRGASDEEVDAAVQALLVISAQNTGSLTIAATDVKPGIDIPVTIILLG